MDTIILKYHKMAFVSGPRQVGKTTLAKEFQKKYDQSNYFNWDVVTDQRQFVRDPFFFEKFDRDPEKPFLLIFDEIHKYHRWKTYLKGVYDKYREEFHLVVTGSGRLDLFKKGGDSLLGRYFSVPLMPLSVGELAGAKPSPEDFVRSLRESDLPKAHHGSAYQQLFQYSGFPEPFLRAEQAFYRMWTNERKKLLVREDIRDAVNIKNISLLETLSHVIPEKVGSPLSTNSLREDIGVAFDTIKEWLLILGQFYYLFPVLPYAGTHVRTLRKEPKVYLHDWVEIENEPIRFENIVAAHLFKAVAWWNATGQDHAALFYLRDKEKREADFLVLIHGKPACVIECKFSDTEIAQNLTYFQAKFKVPVAVQLVHKTGICRRMITPEGILWIMSADRWLATLP